MARRNEYMFQYPQNTVEESTHKLPNQENKIIVYLSSEINLIVMRWCLHNEAVSITM
jgi:hypothetical protein